MGAARSLSFDRFASEIMGDGQVGASRDRQKKRVLKILKLEVGVRMTEELEAGGMVERFRVPARQRG